MKAFVESQTKGLVHCPICTHTVEAEAGFQGKKPLVTPGQKCPRCLAPLDAGYILPMSQAA